MCVFCVNLFLFLFCFFFFLGKHEEKSRSTVKDEELNLFGFLLSFCSGVELHFSFCMCEEMAKEKNGVRVVAVGSWGKVGHMSSCVTFFFLCVCVWFIYPSSLCRFHLYFSLIFTVSVAVSPCLPNKQTNKKIGIITSDESLFDFDYLCWNGAFLGCSWNGDGVHRVANLTELVPWQLG